METFSKKHSQIAKGIAILMMLYHHLFVIPERISAEHFSLLDTILPNAQITIATFCKLCVGIYIFLSGFGLYHQYKSKSLFTMYKMTLLRVGRFMTGFLVIYLLFIPVGYFTGHFVWNWTAFVQGMLGMHLTSFNNTWWFISAYLVLLAVSPVYVYCFLKKSWMKRLLAFLGLLFGFNVVLDNYWWYLIDYKILLPLFVGIACAHFNVYGRITAPLKKIKKRAYRKACSLMCSLLVLVISILFRVYTAQDAVDMRFDALIAPVFVFSVSTLVCELNLDKFFVYCGNHSTNMWLTHAFLCYTYCQALVFLPYYSEIVFVWFVFLSLIVSYGVNLVLVPLNNKLFSPLHKWSYKGFRCWFVSRRKKETAACEAGTSIV